MSVRYAKEFITAEISRRGFDENGDIKIDFAGLCEAADVVLAAAELGYEAIPAYQGQGCWWISLSTSSWRTFDAAEIDGKIVGIRVNDATREAHEAVLDADGWDSDISYAAIGIDSSDVACALDFEGARASGYRFPED
jgi:hypothetical protein